MGHTIPYLNGTMVLEYLGLAKGKGGTAVDDSMEEMD